ncbi:GNAT family N-acetyltransferase [Veronia nyctiphanis]|uniref:GNAT family N-acetyltransferase n=1 Tax=Veronia nyctiphanis TaxID=1278244 RepID=A0A4Q0YRC6_9GAMM|nr:GNAT family N-acetyltransferase [Veronia nyctiphanis]RXJ73185.1 GNAT family N-acetyltransferase [Veronia nyctiphanis]
MIKVQKLNSTHIDSVKAIALGAEQVKFAASAEEFVNNDEAGVHLHVITSDGNVVGFFKLDTLYPSQYSFSPEGSLGLRSFVVDRNQQGKGIGKQAVKALFPYLKENYSQYHAIYLTVNCKNPGAFNCYQKGGFIDTHEKYLGGPHGPQHIMYGSLK